LLESVGNQADSFYLATLRAQMIVLLKSPRASACMDLAEWWMARSCFLRIQQAMSS
jgi:hypothetical protein